MKCVFCKQGETAPKHVTLERYNEDGEPTVIIHNFPAEVCLVCGEVLFRTVGATQGGVDLHQYGSPGREVPPVERPEVDFPCGVRPDIAKPRDAGVR